AACAKRPLLVPGADKRLIVFPVLAVMPDRRGWIPFLAKGIDRDDPEPPRGLAPRGRGALRGRDRLRGPGRGLLARPVDPRAFHAVDTVALQARLDVRRPLQLAHFPVLVGKRPLRRGGNGEEIRRRAARLAVRVDGLNAVGQNGEAVWFAFGVEL